MSFDLYRFYNRMGKKGVLLDNGKQARSSMALYWNNAASKNNNKDKKEKQEAPEQDMETRAGSNLDKWKQHKQKLINKLYEKPEKKEKVDPEAQKERQKKQEEQIQRQLLQKQLNKNKPINIPGFKNANQLKSKLYFEQVKKPDNTTNVLAPRAPGEELTHQEIVQILREKKAKKEMARAHQEKVETTLRQKQQSFDLLMDEFPPQKKQNPPEPVQQPIQKVPQAPQTFFKSELLQKIQRGQHVFKKAVQNSTANQQINMNQQAAQNQAKTQPSFVPKFIPRALWQK